ncbi:hypothetical protein [Streptomyces sp. NPDC058086]|uniref:hypothetical protein n=1 Tax=Streptomyces sp. NPDC058086 TaxID=3346334 RepID=UPI0036EA1A2F
MVGELRDLHEKAEDPDIGRMPADDELFGALLYTEKHASALGRANEDARRAAALKRVLLWEYLREQAEVHQMKAIEAARAAGVEWADLAPPLAVGGPSAAYNKSKRLKALTLNDDEHDGQPVRRTPEAVLEAERRIAERAAAQRRAEEAARRRHELLLPIAHRLLEHRDGFFQDSEVLDWLDEVAAVLPNCRTATQKVSLSTYVNATVRALQRVERETARPVARTEDARLAYAAAVAVCSG